MAGFSIEKRPIKKTRITEKSPKREKSPESSGTTPIEPGADTNTLSWAFFHRLVPDPKSLRSAISDCKDKINIKREENRKRWLDLAEKLTKNEVVRLAPPPSSEAISSLSDKYPHMKGAIGIVRDYVSISRLSEGPANLPPILLSGPPGAGKTAFVLDLVKILGVPSRLVNAPGLTHTFVLGGNDPAWMGSKEGMILSLLLDGTGNPVMVIDEIDKAGQSVSGSRSSSASIEDFLLNVLEPITARRYADEFLTAAHPIDASKIQWIFTANSLEGVSKPLLSRLTVISVREPTAEELREAIIPSIYKSILEENNLVGKVPESLPEQAIRTLEGSPREARKRILRLLAGFAREGTFESTEITEIEESGVKHKSIGFISGGH